MDWSNILNLVLGTGLVATIVGLFSIRSQLKKVKAEAEKAMAEADTVKITNTESATRILLQNIVEPLREELDATRKDLNATKREISRFRKAVEAIPLCPYHAGCPVLGELQDGSGTDGAGKDRQPQGHGNGGNKPTKRNRASPSGHARVKEADTGGVGFPANGGGVQRTDPPGEGIADETA